MSIGDKIVTIFAKSEFFRLQGFSQIGFQKISPPQYGNPFTIQFNRPGGLVPPTCRKMGPRGGRGG